MPNAVLVWLALALALVASPAAAQVRGVPRAEHERIVAELTMDFQAAIARERRLADDREARRIGELQTELRRNEAALQAAVARRGVAQAEIQALRESLEQTRAEYASLVSTVANRDVQASARVLSFQNGVTQILARAPPQIAEALRRFSQGDRVGAWPEIERAALAGDTQMLRDAIGLRTIMVGFGEASAQDLRVLADRLAALDAGDFLAQQTRQSLLFASEGASSPAVHEATVAMTTAAQNDLERHWAFGALGQIEMARGRLPEAERAFEQALQALRRASGVEAPPDSLLMAEQGLLTTLGNLRVSQNDMPGADRYFDQMGPPLRAYVARQPNEALPRDMLVTYLLNYARVKSTRSDIIGAEQLISEAEPLIVRSLAQEPQNKSRIWNAAQHYAQLCYWRSTRYGPIEDPEFQTAEQAASLAAAQTACDRVVEVVRSMPDANASDRDMIAAALIDAANIRLDRNDDEGAGSRYDEAGAIIDALLVETPDNPLFLRRRIAALRGRALAHGGVENWDAVLAAWRPAERAMALQPAEQQRQATDVLLRGMAAEFAQAVNPAELAARRNAVDSLRAVMQQNPDNPGLVRAYLGAVTALARTPGSGQLWLEVVQLYQTLERLDALTPQEQSARDHANTMHRVFERPRPPRTQ